MNNITTAMLELKTHPWARGTPDYIHHSHIKDHIQTAARKCSAETLYLYSTRVERVWKREPKWQIQSATLNRFEGGKLTRSKSVRVCRSFRSSDDVLISGRNLMLWWLLPATIMLLESPISLVSRLGRQLGLIEFITRKVIEIPGSIQIRSVITVPCADLPGSVRLSYLRDFELSSLP